MIGVVGILMCFPITLLGSAGGKSCKIQDFCYYIIFQKLNIFLVVEYCWAIVAAEIIAMAHKLKDPLQPRVDLSIHELIDSCLPEKQEFYKYHLPWSF
jgi:hypothetical protein